MKICCFKKHRQKSPCFGPLLLLALVLSLLYQVSAEVDYGGQSNANRLQENQENGLLDDPAVTCELNSMSLDVRTARPFAGRIFVKGYSQENECQLFGNSSETSVSLTLSFDSCGMKKTRENDGVGISVTIIISFHSIFITKLDRAYRVQCFYQETSKTVSQQLEVGRLTTRAVLRQPTKMPECRYDLLWLNSQGQSIKFAHIGDNVYHKWSCQSDQPDIYCMRVHSCTVNDGQGGQPVSVLDNKGCEVEAFLLGNLEYLGDLEAGQAASVFKFADRPSLHFNCQIDLSLKDPRTGCLNSRPKCTAEEKQPYSTTSSTTAPRAEYAQQETNAISYRDEQHSNQPAPASVSNGQTGRSLEHPLPSVKFQINADKTNPQQSATTKPARKIQPTEVPPSNRVNENSVEQMIARRSFQDNEMGPTGTESDPNKDYQDEMNVVDPGSQNKTRHRRVPKIDLEQSLFVIELDDNPLNQEKMSKVSPSQRHQFAQQHKSLNPLDLSSTVTRHPTHCVPFALFVGTLLIAAFFLLLLIVAGIVTASLLIKAKRLKRKFSPPVAVAKFIASRF